MNKKKKNPEYAIAAIAWTTAKKAAIEAKKKLSISVIKSKRIEREIVRLNNCFEALRKEIHGHTHNAVDAIDAVECAKDRIKSIPQYLEN